MSKKLLEAKDTVEAVELQSYYTKVQGKDEKPSVSNSDEEMKQQLLRSTTTGTQPWNIINTQLIEMVMTQNLSLWR